MPWFTYILICADGTYYTGITADLTRRIEEHNSSSLGSKYTAAHRPVYLIHKESYPNRSLASQREYAIKQMNRGEKELLIKKISNTKSCKINFQGNKS